jgi:hypothetical protein
MIGERPPIIATLALTYRPNGWLSSNGPESQL